jgi:hypothetical protein
LKHLKFLYPIRFSYKEFNESDKLKLKLFNALFEL